jgi:hypothetical protein
MLRTCRSAGDVPIAPSGKPLQRHGLVLVRTDVALLDAITCIGLHRGAGLLLSAAVRFNSGTFHPRSVYNSRR